MPKKNARRARARSVQLLYPEFARYYTAERCAWAPENPRRLFNLAFDSIYPDYEDELSPEQCLGVVYDTLGVGRTGLFRTFDPAEYHGTLPLEYHFANMFARRLRGNLKREVKRARRRKRLRDHSDQTRTAGEQFLLNLLPVFVGCLTARERVVIHLRYWWSMSSREVGARLRVDHKTAGRILANALRKLRRMFGVEVEKSSDSFPRSSRSA